jgi:hypothetical protein
MTNQDRNQYKFKHMKNDMSQYLRYSRYIFGICSLLLLLLGSLFILFIPPLWFVSPLFVYLIYLNFRRPSRELDQFDLVQMCIWFIVFLPYQYFIISLFILHKINKKQIVNCLWMIGFSIVFYITRDKISLIILILLLIFSILYDIWLKQKKIYIS